MSFLVSTRRMVEPWLLDGWEMVELALGLLNGERMSVQYALIKKLAEM